MRMRSKVFLLLGALLAAAALLVSVFPLYHKLDLTLPAVRLDLTDPSYREPGTASFQGTFEDYLWRKDHYWGHCTLSSIPNRLSTANFYRQYGLFDDFFRLNHPLKYPPGAFTTPGVHKGIGDMLFDFDGDASPRLVAFVYADGADTAAPQEYLTSYDRYVVVAPASTREEAAAVVDALLDRADAFEYLHNRLRLGALAAALRGEEYDPPLMPEPR